MICRLCLKDGIEAICIFGEVGVELNIASVLQKHFWFKVKEDDPVSTEICHSCLLKVTNFHEFYEDVEKCQRLLGERSDDKFETSECKRESFDNSDIVVYNDSENAIMIPESIEPDDLANNATKLEEPHEDPLIVDAIENTKLTKKKTEKDASTKTLRRSQRNAVTPVETPDVRKVKRKLSVKQEPTITNVEAEQVVVKKKMGRPRKHPVAPVKTPRKSKKIIEKVDDEDSEGEDAPKKKLSKKDHTNYVRKSDDADEKIAKFLKLQCVICMEIQENFATLRRHMRDAHQCKAYAVCCNKKFRKRTYLVDHVNRHLNPDYFKCDECDKVYADKQCLSNHIYSKHQPEEKKIFQCPHCPSKFAKGFLLEKHRVRHDEPTHMCDVCHKGFPSKALLTNHTKLVHGEYGIMCDICAKVIRGKSAFARHQLEHAGVALPKVQCDICGSWHKDKYAMRKHKRLHNTDGVDHVCTECGKVSPNRAALMSHIQYVHAAKRNHECSVCKKAFKKAVSLKEHMTTHTGEVLYSCTHCPKTFNSKANMYSHRKKMHYVELEEAKRKSLAENALLVEKKNVTLPENSNGIALGDEGISLSNQSLDNERDYTLVIKTGENDVIVTLNDLIVK